MKSASEAMFPTTGTTTRVDVVPVFACVSRVGKMYHVDFRGFYFHTLLLSMLIIKFKFYLFC